MKYTLLGILVLVLIGAGWVYMSYNEIITKNEDVSAKWAQVETQYQRRLDLIPNLVESVKGAAEFETDTFTAVAEARGRMTSVSVDASKLDAASIATYQAAQGELTSALSKLMVVVERYPDLKATENFLNLQSQLEGTENRISVARRDFTESVQRYNVLIKKFPGNILADKFGFAEKGYFTAEEGAETAPKVDFNE